jgi:hypothetical protein
VESQAQEKAITLRRLAVFALSVIAAGVSISWFLAVPMMHQQPNVVSLFPDPLQERFFFDLLGFISGCWLLCFISSLCGWPVPARLAQWLGIIFVSVDQVILIAQWHTLSLYQNFVSGGYVVVPLVFETYFLALYFGLFTLPALTSSGNRSLTGLGTLVVVLPWLLGRADIILGTRILP